MIPRDCFQAEVRFVSVVIASEAPAGQMIRVILDRYREHDGQRRSALAMALAGALATHVKTGKAIDRHP